ncbi:MAG: PQQ-binding-like beta-propeller repeat protein [Terriglobia bacterium]
MGRLSGSRLSGPFGGALRNALLVSIALSMTGFAQSPDGAAVFQQKCAMCHQPQSHTRAPAESQLRQMPRETILSALETGKMKTIGAGMTAGDREAVASFLAASQTPSPQARAGFCAIPRQPVFNDPGWDSWGVGTSNRRFVPAPVAGLKRRDVPKLKLKWAFGFPGAAATYGQPTVFGGRVYAGSEDGTVYSLDAKTGCIDWTFKAPNTVKTAVVGGAGGRLVYFGDVNGDVYALQASDGRVVWKVRADPHPTARITGSPVFFEDRVYVPVSSGEEGAAIDSKYSCCTFRGSVDALDARTGRQIWKAYTLPEAARLTGRRNSAGAQLWGPSGGAVWSSPTIDAKRRVIYVADGNSYSDPSSPYTDAVMAFSLDTGKRLWWRQLTPNDRWNIACVAPDKANCPTDPGHDFDFGAPPMLVSLSAHRSILIAAQKSGIVYGLDPDHDGQIVWQSRIGKGGPLGGVEWGGSAGKKDVLVPLSDWDPDNPKLGGGLYALNVKTGERVWYDAPVVPACATETGCSAAQSSPTTQIPGVVFSGSEDGHLRAYNSANGKLLWDFNALRVFPTVNGAKANGGSMTATGPAIVGGMLYVQAGYTNNISGNVLLAFSVDGK